MLISIVFSTPIAQFHRFFIPRLHNPKKTGIQNKKDSNNFTFWRHRLFLLVHFDNRVIALQVIFYSDYKLDETSMKLGYFWFWSSSSRIITISDNFLKFHLYQNVYKFNIVILFLIVMFIFWANAIGKMTNFFFLYTVSSTSTPKLQMQPK